MAVNRRTPAPEPVLATDPPLAAERLAATERPTGTDRTHGTGPIRIVIVTLMGVVIAIVAGGVFDRVLPALVLPPIVVGVATLASTPLRRSRQVALLAIASIASGVALALLSDGGIGDIADAVVRGPRRLLTTEWPSPVEPSIVVAIGLLIALTTAAAGVLADAQRWRLTPLVPLAIATVAVIALGAPSPPPWWTIALLGAGALAIGMLPPGELLAARITTVLGDRTMTVTLAGIAIVALGTSTAIATTDLPATDRADPRQVEEAGSTSSILDPIEATVALRRADPPIAMFEITDRSTLDGRALPTRWRLAALDVYDGERWVPQVTLRPIGERLGPVLLEPGVPPPFTYEVVYRTDDLDLVPFPGRPLSIDAAVETDLDRVAVRLTEQPVPGTTVVATSAIAPSIAAVAALDAAPFARRPVDEIAQSFTEAARELAGDGDLLRQLGAIEATMRTEWVLDRDAAGGGQQLALLDRFVTETRRGTREQFVTAFVLFARSLGVDARVATGFVIPPESPTSPLVVESVHAAAWPEVRLAGGPDAAGDRATGTDWLAFDPVPPRQESVEDDEPTPPDAQSPAAAQPPVQPPADVDDDEEDRAGEATTDDGRWRSIATWVIRVGVGASIGVLPLVLVIGTILAVKWQRRRRRLRHPDPAHRVRGAWANVTDALVDAGITIGPAWTDDRIARGGAALAPSVPHELRRLAAMSTAVTFGAGVDAWRLVDDATSTSRSIDAALGAERTRWQRVRWRLSLRSLRKRSRSPVVA